MKSLLLPAVLIASAAVTAAADPIPLQSVPVRIVGGSVVIQTGSVRGGPPELGPQASASLTGSSGVTLSGHGAGFVACDEGCAPGESLSLSSSVFLTSGSVVFEGETLDFDAFGPNLGGIDLDLRAVRTFSVPTPAGEPVMLQSPFTLTGSARAPGFLPPTTPGGNPTSVTHMFDLSGQGTATGTFSVGELGGVGVLFFDRLRFDFTNQAPVPEPCSLVLLATGTALCARRRVKEIRDRRRSDRRR